MVRAPGPTATASTTAPCCGRRTSTLSSAITSGKAFQLLYRLQAHPNHLAMQCREIWITRSGIIELLVPYHVLSHPPGLPLRCLEHQNASFGALIAAIVLEVLHLRGASFTDFLRCYRRLGIVLASSDGDVEPVQRALAAGLFDNAVQLRDTVYESVDVNYTGTDTYRLIRSTGAGEASLAVQQRGRVHACNLIPCGQDGVA